METGTCDFLTILRVLVKGKVDFIVVGGVCAVLQGAPVPYYRERKDRKLRPQLSHLASPGHQLLITSSGPLNVLGTVGTDLGYEELLSRTVKVLFDRSLEVRALDLETLIQIKEEAGRKKDKAVLPILKQTLKERRKQ